jgi:hypothetical protein
MRLKHHIVLLGRLDNGLGYYRFAYHGSNKTYVGVLAQEVQTVSPSAVVSGRDGYLQVLYGRLGLKFQTYDKWIASGARIPVTGSAPGAKHDRILARRVPNPSRSPNRVIGERGGKGA